MSTMMSTMERIAADEAFGPVVGAGEKPPLSEGEAAEREAAANLAAVQATADTLRAGGSVETAPADATPQADLAPLPRVGSLVTFYPRPGEVMRGRKEAAAIVVHRDVAKRTLDLVVIYDANDFRDQERIKERTVEGERGWVQHADQAPAILTVNRVEVDNSAMQGEFAVLRASLFGDFEAPEQSIVELLDSLDERLGKLEDAKPAPAKRERRVTRRKNRPRTTKTETPAAASEI